MNRRTAATAPGGSRIGRSDVHWEDLALGDVVHGPGVTIGESHLVGWAGLTGDRVSLHLDEQVASQTMFGARIAHGPLTLSLALGLLTQTGIFDHVEAWLGVDGVRALLPVFIGDTVHADARLDVKRATSKPGRGIWTFGYEVINQRDATVMTFSNSVLVSRRDPEDAQEVATR